MVMSVHEGIMDLCRSRGTNMSLHLESSIFSTSFVAEKIFLQSLYEPKHPSKQSLHVSVQHSWRLGRFMRLSSQRLHPPNLYDGIVCRGLREGSGRESPSEDDDSDKDHESAAPLADWKVPLGGAAASPVQDWRAFRAGLVAGEKVAVGKDSVVGMSGALGKMWAHPLGIPEAGCVLVATDKLDGQMDFERTVILLLRMGSNKPREGPFGVILNRASAKTINHLESDNKALADVFGGCPYFYGGPLESELFLFIKEGGSHEHFAQIIPGISHIGVGGLHHAAQLLKNGSVSVNDFRFYMGYAGWSFDQLMDEIASGYWHVAACSATLLKLTSTTRLWKKTLRLMGGEYAELSRKPNNGGL